ERQARRSVPRSVDGERLMGALARLLARRGGTGAAASTTSRAFSASPARPRSPEGLLHASGMSIEQLRIAWIAVSWLLTYPDEETLSRHAMVRELASRLP